MSKSNQQKPKQKVDFQIKAITFAFMAGILLLVTLLMPGMETIGICLQVLAGLLFIIDQIWNKVINRENLESIKSKIEKPSFLDKVPLIAIPLCSPILLVVYFRFGTDAEWYNAFFSISMAVAVSSFVYVFFVSLVTKMLKRFSSFRNSFLRHTSYRPVFWSNVLILLISLIAIFVEVLSIYPISRLLHGNSIIVAIPTAAFLTLMMFTLYAFLLSFMYFVLLVLLKLIHILVKLRIVKSESDRNFAKKLLWMFLVTSWIWGGVLLVVNSILS
jgi:hypothetical protein